MVLLVVTGCSALMSGPRAPNDPGACSDSYVRPGLDGMVSIAMLGTMMLVASDSDGGSDGGRARVTQNAVNVGLAVPGVLFALSAVVGAHKVSSCKTAKLYGVAAGRPVEPTMLVRENAAPTTPPVREQPVKRLEQECKAGCN